MLHFLSQQLISSSTSPRKDNIFLNNSLNFLTPLTKTCCIHTILSLLSPLPSPLKIMSSMPKIKHSIRFWIQSSFFLLNFYQRSPFFPLSSFSSSLLAQPVSKHTQFSYIVEVLPFNIMKPFNGHSHNQTG